MDILFLIFLDQICPKWIKLDKTWSNWKLSNGSTYQKIVSIKIFHIYKKDANYTFFYFFGCDLSKMDQTWSNWKLSNSCRYQKILECIKSCHIYKKDENGHFVFDFIGSDLSKMDQTWPNWKLSKGQLISKGLFDILKFIQKWSLGQMCTEKCPNVPFLEESRRPKSPFEN